MTKPNFENRTLFHGDNLDVMRGMNSETVDLIATDPPFNKSRDFHATPDSLAKGAKFQDRWSWERDVHQEWIDQITDDYPKLMEAIKSARYAHSDGMGAFMCFMAVRLLEMRRILKPTGSIYLHCDPTASHYLKAVMDAIFGYRNFVNEIIWRYSWGNHTDKRWNKKHDVLLFYVIGKAWTFNAKHVMEKREDEVLRRLATGNPSATMAADKGKVKDKTLKLPSDVWNVPTINGMARERTGYPTQKPLALYERIIKASSNPGDMVLDPFAGCATTCVAAERLGRQWAGIDIWKKAHEVVVDRLQKEVGLFGDVHYTKDLPIREDSEQEEIEYLEPIYRRQRADWERLTHKQIVEILQDAQDRNKNGFVECAGCGRDLEKEFMELDHIMPRRTGGKNTIDNRVLLCRPCNGRKSAKLAMPGLWDENKKSGWMKDPTVAENAMKAAIHAADKQKTI